MNTYLSIQPKNMLDLEFRVWRDKHGEWLWTLREGKNKQPIAVSGQLYPNYEMCIDAINLVKNSVNASIIRDF
ncbi:MAG: DUF1508 domain-containing protein [Snowella sp.]|nr:DUF1508 domain-containing protein [Snowella sp.]